MKAQTILSLIIPAVALIVSGCRSKEIKPREYTSVPLYMAGQEIPGADQEKYLYNGSVKMYSVGRLVDPGSGTMREAGTVYRIESAPKWNLIPQYDANPESFARKKMLEQYADSAGGHISQSLEASREIRKGQIETQKEIKALEEKCRLLQEANTALLKMIRKNSEDAKISVENMKLMQTYIRKLESRMEDLKIQDFRGRR
ncbi:MAG: hypothetical protein IJH79_14350 [Lentisphaeria bacterium]|nr:hypothetical protein [Lentisphaeria bacterium]